MQAIKHEKEKIKNKLNIVLDWYIKVRPCFYKILHQLTGHWIAS